MSTETDNRPTAQWSDAQLVEAIRSGDDRGSEEVVRRYGPRMLQIARRYMKHEQDAQDALQDAFLSAFKNIASFQGDAKLSTWMHRIVVNAALMKLRKKSRTSETEIDALLPRFQDGQFERTPSDWAVTFDTAVRDREIRELVRGKIQELPDSYRTVLLLRDIDEMSTSETADLLGISESAVKTRLHRARQALRELLDPIMQGSLA